jgi:RNA polymerase sigma-70 factor (ECF subfamily)
MGVQADREAGEASDFADLYRAHAVELTRFATVLVGPRHAEDVVADAIARVFATTAPVVVTDARAYLYRAVLNQARRTLQSDAARRRRERRHADLRTPACSDEPDREVIAAVARLSDRQRAVVFFAYWQDLEPASIASVLGISEGSVRRHLARARARLRRTLDDRR